MPSPLEKLMDAIHRDPSDAGGVADFFNAATVFPKGDYDNAAHELKRRYAEEYIPDAVRRAEETSSHSEVTYLNGVEAHGSALGNPDKFFDANPHLKGQMPQVVVEHHAEVLRHTVAEITATTGKLDGHLVAPPTASFRRNKAEI
ncbi:MAG: hypothetical protein IT560_14225 [Alphaproteobacteria bacterium]|jgi:hypothetical protein|nr:hypothetical protein [Alphaproteobacteria bacterium]